MKIVNDNLIKKWEELRLEAYLPTKDDVLTIGWGHTRNVYPGMVITKEEAEMFFGEDVRWVEKALNRLVKVPLNQNQFDALASLVFNIGETQFRTSTILRKLNAGDYEGAAAEFPKWRKQKGKVLRGLVRRRAEEMEYFLSPIDSVSALTPDPVDPLKSLARSKEVWGGVAAVLTGASSFLGSLTPETQNALVALLPWALVAFGVFFVYNRLKARGRGER